MFLDDGIDELPEEFAGHSRKAPSLVDPDDDWYEFTVKPRRFVSLGVANWPEHVVAHIAKIFAAEGVPKPRKLKLVEPYAHSLRREEKRR
jgi:hypothetical protein